MGVLARSICVVCCVLGCVHTCVSPIRGLARMRRRAINSKAVTGERPLVGRAILLHHLLGLFMWSGFHGYGDLFECFNPFEFKTYHHSKINKTEESNQRSEESRIQLKLVETLRYRNFSWCLLLLYCFWRLTAFPNVVIMYVPMVQSIFSFNEKSSYLNQQCK